MYNDQQIQECIRNSKELTDLYDDRQRMMKLYEERSLKELQQYIVMVMQKHPFETAIYNLININMPRSIEENAINCIGFINGLIVEKLMEILSKH